MSIRKIWFPSVFALVSVACSAPQTVTPDSSAPETTETIGLTSAQDRVEITLIDKLDGVTSSYCIDVAGGNQDIDITRGLQAHTCYSYRGTLGTDQTFLTSKLADNILYMPDFDVCAMLASLSSGASVGLADCDGSELQALAFSEIGTISPISASNMCLTAGTESRFGRSDVHQIKALTLEACSPELGPYQQWDVRGIEG